MIKRIYNLFFTVVFVVAITVYFIINKDSLKPLVNISLIQIILLSLLILLFFYISGQVFNYTLQLLGCKLNFAEIIGLTVLSNFSNYLAPILPGAAIKAVYLKSTRNIEYSQFSACFAANIIISFMVYGLLGFLLLLLPQFVANKVYVYLMVICLSCISIPVIIYFIKIPKFISDKRYFVFIQNILNAFEVIRTQKWKIIKIGLYIIIQLIIGAIILYYAYNSLGLHCSIYSSFIVNVFISIANIIPITPNNIGIQEILTPYLFMITGFDFTAGLIAATIIRILHLLITFLLTPFFYLILIKSKVS